MQKLKEDLPIMLSLYNLSLFLFSDTLASIEITKIKTFDASRIHGLSFHPACVVLVALSSLKTETTRGGNRDSAPKEFPGEFTSSLILNICGRVVMLQVCFVQILIKAPDW